MCEFVILYHEMPAASDRASHWDLMLRENERLLTWALNHDPLVSDSIQVQQLPDHRLDYLHLEGPISGNRGSVKQIAKGSFRWLMRNSIGDWSIRLETGQWTMDCELNVDGQLKISRVRLD